MDRFYIPLFASAALLCLSGAQDAPPTAEESPVAPVPASPPPLPDPPSPRTNIILILADDLGWDDCSPYGHPSLPTPNLQRLANEGMRFEHAFVTASSCSPSRASIITGQYPSAIDAEQLHWPLPKDKVTFVEKLKAAGYWTGAAGKWHLGDAVKDRFDKIMAVDDSGFQLPPGATGDFSETLHGDAQSGCGDWIHLLASRDPAKPFFLWLASLDPHRPYHPETTSASATPEMVRVPPYQPDTPAVRQDYQLYYDEIMRLDRCVGDLLDQLKKENLEKNTLVCFLSDNGRPFPRDKTTLYDSGIRTPLLIRWPEVVEPGSACAELISSVDLARTFLEVARIAKIPPVIKGRSFVPQLHDPKKPGQEYIFAEKNWHDYEDRSRAVRNKRYKYIRNYYEDLPLTPPADAVRSPTYAEMKRLGRENRLLPHQMACFVMPRFKEELYDTLADPHELNNLAADPRFASVVLAMRAALKNWESAQGDGVRTPRTPDEFDRVTGEPNDFRVRPRKSKAEMIQLHANSP